MASTEKSDSLDGWAEVSRPPSVQSVPISAGSQPGSGLTSTSSSPPQGSSPLKACRQSGRASPLGLGPDDKKQDELPPKAAQASKLTARRTKAGRGQGSKLGVRRITHSTTWEADDSAVFATEKSPESSLPGAKATPDLEASSQVEPPLASRGMQRSHAAETASGNAFVEESGRRGSTALRSGVPAAAAPTEIEEDDEDDEGNGGWNSGGWGAWGGLSSLGASVQRAAATAAGDIAELTSSFQQVLHEIAAEEEGDAVEGVATGEGRRLVGSPGTAVGPDPDVPPRRPDLSDGAGPPGGADERDSAPAYSPGQLAKRDAVLARLQGEPSSRDALYARLRAVDDGVDRVAQEATAALSSLWGSVTGAVRHASGDAAETSKRSGLLSGLRARAQTLLSEVVGEVEDEEGGAHALEKAVAVPGGSRRPAKELGFDECLFIYGGQDALAELEKMSAEHARLANRVVAALDPAAGEALSARLPALAAILSRGWAMPAEGQEESPEASSRAARDHALGLEPRGEALDRGHGMVEDVAEAAVRGLAGAEPGTAGAKAMAEITSACLERLLALAKSVTHSMQSGRPSDDRVVWPSDGARVAGMLAREAALMGSEIRRVAAAWERRKGVAEQDAPGPVAPGDEPAPPPDGGAPDNGGRRALERRCAGILETSLALCGPVVWWACEASKAGRTA